MENNADFYQGISSELRNAAKTINVSPLEAIIVCIPPVIELALKGVVRKLMNPGNSVVHIANELIDERVEQYKVLVAMKQREGSIRDTTMARHWYKPCFRAKLYALKVREQMPEMFW